MRQKLPKCTRRLLVEALVFSHMLYCLTVWGSCTAGQKQRIQKAINFGVRIVVGLGRRDQGPITTGWTKFSTKLY